MNRSQEMPVVMFKHNMAELTKNKLIEDLREEEGINVSDLDKYSSVVLMNSNDSYLNFYAPKDNGPVYFYTLGNTMPAPIISKLKKIYEGLEIEIESE